MVYGGVERLKNMNRCEPELVNLLEELVAVPSVNPEDNPDPSIAGELKMAEHLAGLLEKKGFSIEWDDRESGRPNLIASFGSDSPRRTILFESHLDTVGVAGMKVAPFKATIKQGRFFGRGACDTKGPMAAALWAMKPELLAALKAVGCRLIYVGAMGEEKGNVGAARLVSQRKVQADECIVLEPTELAVIHTHKGALWFSVEVEGLAAHGSNPQLGMSAIQAMHKVMTFLEEQMEDDRKKFHNPLLGSGTMNIGVIHGGDAVNIVPSRCRIEVDRRTLPEENCEDMLNCVSSFLEKMKSNQVLSDYSVRIIKAGAPFLTANDSRLVRRLSAGCRSAGLEPRLEGVAWYCDAGPLAAVCREIVVFGPGSIRQAHTADEFIELESLQQGCDVLQHFLKQVVEELKT